MSKKNYGNYFKAESVSSEEATRIPTDIKTPRVPIVEQESVSVEPEMEEVVEPTPEPAPAPVYGTVTDCSKLNIRTNPHTQSEVLCKVDAGAQLTIDLNKSTTEWYKVCTASGVEGYCMKKFVALKK